MLESAPFAADRETVRRTEYCGGATGEGVLNLFGVRGYDGSYLNSFGG